MEMRTVLRLSVLHIVRDILDSCTGLRCLTDLVLNSLRPRISKDNDEQDLPDSELTDLLNLFDIFVVMSF